MTWARLLAPVPLGRERPATLANIARNAAGQGHERAARWASARDAAWQLLDRHVPCDACVAIIGAGNGDDLPLARLAARASRLDLFDLDMAALRRGRHRCPPELRKRMRLRRCDVTAGAADRIARAVAVRRRPPAPKVSGPRLPEGAYDVVIGDVFYSQLLYPALVDASVPAATTRRVLARYGPSLTDAIVAGMHAAGAAGARVVHLHDIAGWWDGHPQPVSLREILSHDGRPDAFALISRCRQPEGADPRDSALRLGARVLDTALWEWAFAPGVSYLVCATVTDQPRQSLGST